jgi:TolB-like protein
MRTAIKPFLGVMVVWLTGMMVGCASVEEEPFAKFKTPTYAIDGASHASRSNVIIKSTYDGVDLLFERSLAIITPDDNILATSIVNVSDVNASSDLGRMMTEQVAGRIAQKGLKVVELKLRNDVSVNSQGELLLSREYKNLRQSYGAQAAVTGTYAVGAAFIHVNLKLIALESGQILSSVDFVIPASEWYQRDARVLVGH